MSSSLSVELVTMGLPFVLYWTWSLLFLAVDLTKKPNWLYRRKILLSRRSHPTPCQQFTAAARLVFVDQLVILLFYVLLCPFVRASMTTTSYVGKLALIKFVLFAVMVHRVWFYYVHRLLHQPLLYRWIHCVHHRWTSPSAVVSANAHPLENLILNAGPVVLAVVTWKPDLTSLAVFLTWAVSQSCLDHSGYRLVDNGHHDTHHKLLTCNYGIELLDRLHGTLHLVKPEHSPTDPTVASTDNRDTASSPHPT